MELDRKEIIKLLQSTGEERIKLHKDAAEIRNRAIGNKVYFRGLIEFSNVCSKNCLYCGIRSGNTSFNTYQATDEEVFEASRFAYENGFGSVALQSGEVSSADFIRRVDRLLKGIKKLSNNKLGITLSCGEQSYETYRRWFESGAHRYLLRIEATNRKLYEQIHPNDEGHSFENRLKALVSLRNAGYQVGTGVMIGLPFQTLDDLAGDLLFFKELDIDMCGMGPYIENEDTPLYQYRNMLKTKQERFDLSLNMIALLRMLMPNINIASSTALQSIDPLGREKGISAGANIIMPNLTPLKYREDYLLYKNKPGLDSDAIATTNLLKKSVAETGCVLAIDEWGDSRHFKIRQTAIKQQ